jgi:hypothetical protein
MKRDLVREIALKRNVGEDGLHVTLSRIKRRHNLKSVEQAACYYILSNGVDINVSSVIDDVTRNLIHAKAHPRSITPNPLNSPKPRGSKVNLPRIRWISPHYYLLAGRLPDFYGRLFLFENAVRLMVNSVMEKVDANWWETKIKTELYQTYDYAEKRKAEQAALPMVGQGRELKPYERITLGHLEEIIVKYKQHFVPSVFPNLQFFTGHMVIIKSVRHAIAHMSPATTAKDIRHARNDIEILLQYFSSLNAPSKKSP